MAPCKPVLCDSRPNSKCVLVSLCDPTRKVTLQTRQALELSTAIATALVIKKNRPKFSVEGDTSYARAQDISDLEDAESGRQSKEVERHAKAFLGPQEVIGSFSIRSSWPPSLHFELRRQQCRGDGRVCRLIFHDGRKACWLLPGIGHALSVRLWSRFSRSTGTTTALSLTARVEAVCSQGCAPSSKTCAQAQFAPAILACKGRGNP